jgi:hypothetical protein
MRGAEETIADLGDFFHFAMWIEAGLEKLAAAEATPRLVASVAPLEYEGASDAGADPLGRMREEAFRRLVSAAFLADLASYPAPVDRVELCRLLHVMHVFPRGFRVWIGELDDGSRLPVGYSGWYPVAETSFELLERTPERLQDRAVVPLPAVTPGGGFLYVFNYSVIPQLRGTSASGRLVKSLAADVAGTAWRGLAAITVSPEGARVAGRFGMRKTGALFVGGCQEDVYTIRRD